MRALRRFLMRLARSVVRRRDEERLRREIEEHLALQTEENLRAGLSPVEARRQAVLKFGGVESVKERYRDEQGFPMLENLVGDARYGIRALLRSPGFLLVAVISLALGIGANTTIFTVANAVLHRPLPFKDPDKLVVIYEQNTKREQSRRDSPLSAMVEWQEKAQSFEQIEGMVWHSEAKTLSGEVAAERVTMQFLTPGAFSLLGVKPARGRAFTRDDAVPGNRSLIISYGLWQRRFGGDPGVIGRSVRVADELWPIVGVMPAGVWTAPWMRNIDLWTPIDMRLNELTPQTRWITTYARLKQTVTLKQAQAEMDAFALRMAEQQPDAYKDWTVKVEPVGETYARGAGTALYMLLGATGFILLIACANVANLLLARGAKRQKEIAVRMSLGAGRRRLFQQMLTESLLLSLIGGAAGIAAGRAGLRIFLAMAPDSFPRTDEIAINSNVLLFTLAVSLLTGIVFGLAPAWRAAQLRLAPMLKEGGRQSASPSRHRSNRILAVCEVTLAFVLLVGAGLMINSVLRLERVDVGYKPENLLTGRVQLGSSKYVQVLSGNMKRVTPQAPMFYQQVKERLESIPGVRSAAVASMAYSQLFWVVGRPAPPRQQLPQATVQEIGPDYFETLGISLLKGRPIDESDREGTPWVAVVNQALARSIFPDEDPLGKRLHLRFGASHGEERDDEQARLIVGVVADVKSWGPAQRAMPAIYTSDRQHQWVYPSGDSAIHLQKMLYIRSRGEPSSFGASMRQAVSEVDRDQTVFDVMPETNRLEMQIGRWRFFRNLYGIFAGLALALAVVGIYGVMSYSVAERRREFGIRMALGAETSNVLRQVLGQGLALSFAGVGIGIAAGLGLTRFLSNLLFEVQPQDPLTFLAVSLVMLAVAALSCYIPARRATMVDPANVLRTE
ncbi:MAG: ABC transporter permease [Bryobacteraceae bacterium]|nr:ABC transporter permease [Bryobacteraceae bacterium]